MDERLSHPVLGFRSSSFPQSCAFLLSWSRCGSLGASRYEKVLLAQSCPILYDTMDYSTPPPTRALCPWDYWSGLPFSSPGDLPNPGIKPRSPALQADSLPPEPPFLLATMVIFHIVSTPYLLILFPSSWGEYLVGPTGHPDPPGTCLLMLPATPNHNRAIPTPCHPSLPITESQNLSRTACSHDSAPHIQSISSCCHFHSSILTKLYVTHGLGTKEYIWASFPQRSFCQARMTH